MSFDFFGTINTHSRGVIKLDGTLPHNLHIDEEVISEGTNLYLHDNNGLVCTFKETSAVTFLKIELNQIPHKTIH